MGRATRHRAEVVGSMLRREDLKAASAPGGPAMPPAELRQIQDRAIDEAIAIQERAGVDVVTDGELRRWSFIAMLTEVVEGVGIPDDAADGVRMLWHGPDGDAEYAPPTAVIGKLRRLRSLSTEEYTYARARTDKPIKVTLPSPLMLSPFWRPGVSDRTYSDPFEAFRDGAEVISQEIRELEAIGCRYVQIDAPELITHVLNPDQREIWSSLGIEPDRLLGEGVEILDHLAAGHPDVSFALHICRGNRAGKWLAEGGYDAVARQIFPRVPNFDALALEYDSPRAGSFEPLRDVPDDKVVILGLVSTKTDELESADELTERIADAARHFPREQLALSTQCGFASLAEGNPIAWETQERKLKLVADVAHSALD